LVEANDASHAFRNLLDDLFDSVIPNLEHHPHLGRDVLARTPRYTKALQQHRKLLKCFGNARLREYIAGDYLVLYAVRGNQIDLLAIKHHRQLSFDLKRFWL